MVFVLSFHLLFLGQKLCVMITNPSLCKIFLYLFNPLQQQKYIHRCKPFPAILFCLLTVGFLLHFPNKNWAQIASMAHGDKLRLLVHIGLATKQFFLCKSQSPSLLGFLNTHTLCPVVWRFEWEMFLILSGIWAHGSQLVVVCWEVIQPCWRKLIDGSRFWESIALAYIQLAVLPLSLLEFNWR